MNVVDGLLIFVGWLVDCGLGLGLCFSLLCWLLALRVVWFAVLLVCVSLCFVLC